MVGVLFRARAAVEYIEFYACVSSSDNPSQGSPSRSLQIHCCEDRMRVPPGVAVIATSKKVRGRRRRLPGSQPGWVLT